MDGKILRRLAILAGSVFALSAAGAQAAQRTLSANEGAVAATLTYEQGSDHFGNTTFANLELGISRGGQSFYQQPVSSPSCGTSCLVEQDPHASALTVRDLEGNGQANVVLDLYTGGAHCCSVVQVFSFDPGVMAYRLAERNFGDPGARLTSLEPGKLEFESADDRFAYAFTSFAYSGLPSQIWEFREGRFVDVTREFPALIIADAKRQFKNFLANRRRGLGLGFIAAWAADEDQLGGRTVVDHTLAREARLHHLRSGDRLSPSGTAFVEKLERFLKKTGYA
jgi:hypothetical protein